MKCLLVIARGGRDGTALASQSPARHPLFVDPTEVRNAARGSHSRVSAAFRGLDCRPSGQPPRLYSVDSTAHRGDFGFSSAFFKSVVTSAHNWVNAFLLVRREFGQDRRVADAGQVGVLLPVTQGSHDGRSGLGRAGVDAAAPGGQVGLQPVEGLLAQAGALVVVELGRVFALAGGGQRGKASGVVAVVVGRRPAWGRRRRRRRTGRPPCGRAS